VRDVRRHHSPAIQLSSCNIINTALKLVSDHSVEFGYLPEGGDTRIVPGRHAIMRWPQSKTGELVGMGSAKCQKPLQFSMCGPTKCLKYIRHIFGMDFALNVGNMRFAQ
jgi:hypothetical protein